MRSDIHRVGFSLSCGGILFTMALWENGSHPFMERRRHAESLFRADLYFSAVMSGLM